MKNRLFLFCLLAVFATSCVNELQDDNQDVYNAPVFYATIEQAGEPSTKVFADDSLRVLWNADDRVSIFNKTTFNREYRFEGQDGANSGTFERVPSDKFVASNPLNYVYSVYPYNENTSISNDGEITVYLPAEQTYREDSFGLGANTMIAITEDDELMFKNLCGYFAIKLYGDNVSVSSITLRGNNNEYLAGKAAVVAQTDTAPTIQFDEANATKELTLTFATPITIGSTAETATTFWFVIPPTVFENGISLTVKDNRNGVFEKTTSGRLEINRNTLKSSVPLLVIPEPSDDPIQFADENIKAKLVASFDTNGDGELSYAEAAAVTSGDAVKSAFGAIKTYTSFDEFQYFTGITGIPKGMFENWNVLTSVILPDSVTSIGQWAFRGCSGLIGITIPESVTSIGGEAFGNCTSLSSIVIPESVTNIGEAAFANCKNISSVTIINGVTSIGVDAFLDCISLTNVTIPNSVTSIGDAAFGGCTSLLYFSGKYATDDGLYLIDEGHLISLACAAFTGRVVLPDGINTIGRSIFRGCKNVTSVTVPDGVTSIDGTAFAFCPSITSVLLPNSLTSIGPSAFRICGGLTSITIPWSVTSIGGVAFRDCTALTAITVLRATPPVGGSGMFYNTNDCPIYVPASSVDAYKAAEYWADYADRIQPLAPLPEAVDLGLSVKWASWNVGASAPEEYGDYFAWGETEPKDDYSWLSYKFALGTDTQGPFSKYVTIPSYGAVDNKTVLDPEDDAAHVNLGGAWRMPTEAECTELWENCTWTWTKENGVNGRRVTSNKEGYTDKSIFLPAAGFYDNAGLLIAGSRGHYWASSLSTSGPYNAWYVQFDSEHVFRLYYTRHRNNGQSVRPVCE